MVKPWQYTPAPLKRPAEQPLDDIEPSDEYPARERVGTGAKRQSTGLALYGDLLHSLMVWVSQHHELRIQHPNGLTLDAKPDHVRDAVTQHPWGVLYTDERHVLLTWGDVPASALLGKRDLKTDELLVKETRTAA